MQHVGLAASKKPAFADQCGCDWPPGSAMAGYFKPLVKGVLRRSFLGYGHALQWMSLGQAQGCPRIDQLWPGQSLDMNWDPGPVGQGLWAGAVCDKGISRPGG